MPAVGANDLRPTPFEIASGLVREPASARVDGLPPPDGRRPLQALEDATLPALRRPPCLVSFSGGVDSSLVLAAAARAARREGLPPPVPATLRFSDAPGAEEAAWQEHVAAHLGIGDWERIAIRDELDLIGPIAREVLLRHGLLYPANTFFHVPVLERCREGSLLTGVGGDQLLLSRQWRAAAAVLTGRRHFAPRDLLRVGLALSPLPIRSAVLLRRSPAGPEWMRGEARRDAARVLARRRAAEPIAWGSRVAWRSSARDLAMTRFGLDLVAAEGSTQVVNPLLDRPYLAALQKAGGRLGWESRRDAVRDCFGDVLPPELVSRATKARFDEAFWREDARSFANNWDGQGLDPEMVDARALRAEWLARSPNARTGLALQAAWLAHHRGGRESLAPQPRFG